MFGFFVKKSQIVLECFTHLDYVYNYTPVDYGRSFYPEWWKQTPSEVNEVLSDGSVSPAPTIKGCRGIIDFYKNSAIIPSWFELELLVMSKGDTEEFSWRYNSSSNEVLSISPHSQIQFEKFALTEGHNVKLDTPWHFRSKNNVNWVWSQPTWNLREHLNTFTVLPGVVNFKYQHSTPINLLVVNENNLKTTVIKPNVPLVVIHPMSEYDVVIKRHLVDEKEFKSLDQIGKLFLKRNVKDLYSLYDKKKQFIDNKDRKCPFNFKNH